MKKRTRRWIASYTRRGNRRETWKKLVQVMACIVVFCTTYAMILPAITLEQQYACGLEAHTHGGTCFDSAGNLICSEAEHTHDRACGSDPEADLESRSQWERTVSGVEITGYWDRDLLAIAKTQLGYEESVRNFQIRSDGTMAGITRYGQWYDAPYRDWNAMFVAFCLNYSQISRLAIPLDSHGGDWMNRLNELGIVASPGTDTPIPGDIAFYTGSDGKTVQIGIVSAAEAGQLRIIAGDVNDRVAELTVPESWILGICSMDAARERYAEEYPGKMPIEIPTEPATEPADDEPWMVSYIAETENYIVVVTCSSELGIPDDAVMQASEYPKESDIFRQRCEEAGYELEWLLNIGFYRDGCELEIHGDFGVQVISKRGYELGQDITHFADDGTERIDGTPVTDGTQEGQTSVAFPAPGFSDFGGGIATVAETGPVTLTVVNPQNLVSGVEYVIFYQYGRSYIALGNRNCASVNVGSGDTPIVGSEFDMPAGTSLQDVTWRLEQVPNSSNFNLFSTSVNSPGNRLHVHSGSVRLQNEEKQLSVYDVNGAQAKLGHSWRSGYNTGTNYLHYQTRGWTGITNNNGNTSNIYFAVKKDYPHAVHTGDVSISRLRFLNFRGDGSNGVNALEGCTFKIVSDAVDANGKPVYETTLVSKNDPIVQLPASIPPGGYTITEISSAEGYVRDNNPVRHFTIQEVQGEKSFVSNQSIGVFINNPVEELGVSKTAQVEDYKNRIYQILMDAKANLRQYTMDPVDIRLVVDQSNSMLFPSGMTPYQGKTVTLGLNDSQNDDRMNALGLDRSKMYYIISDPEGTSTVWCIWHDGETWMYQDASYYAKAKHNNEAGYQTPDEQAIFPINDTYSNQPTTATDPRFTKARANGGALDKNMTKSGLGTYIDSASNDQRTFQIYTANGEFNRLHYLEEALSYLVVELADANPQNRVSLTLFTKTVDHNQCILSKELTPDAVTEILDAVDSIKTSGGTRQDIALKHVYDEASHEPKRNYKSYTVLITDGAPVTSGDQKTLGNPYSDWAVDENSAEVYPRIRAEAQKIRNNERSTLMTVALAMENVDGGAHVLQTIATPGYSYAYSDASRLIDALQELVYRSFTMDQEIPVQADLVDEISDSFYPIAWVYKGSAPQDHQLLPLKDSPDQDASKDWVVLQVGDWITADGMLTTAGARNASGQLLQNSDGDLYVKWTNRSISNGWDGSFYVKAKEDFIGGNAIQTNKDATVTITSDNYPGNDPDAKLPSPTVNVRLLDMNQMHSEVTVYLGDLINASGDSPLDSLKTFYENTHVIKLISDDGKVLNKPYQGDTLPEGLGDATFTLRYAMGRDLTESEWSILTAGGTVTVPYTYDDPSSVGPVGYFSFRLEKQGDTADFDVHQATQSCPPEGAHAGATCAGPAETYTLHVTYTAYELGESGRPETNVHNAPAGPGREVGTGATLETGLGTVAKENLHEVHVISGRIEITKKFVSTVTTTQDQTFTFQLHRTEDGDNTANDKTGTITIPTGTLAGSATLVFRDLPRGTYTVTEAAHPEYMVQKIRVLDTTNCHSTPAPGSEDQNVIFTLGNNRSDENVIGKADTERYTAYVDAPNGVFGAAEFTNKPIVYEGEIPVKKVWDDGAENHPHDSVYLVLYRNGVPVVDEHGAARLLKLDAANNWQGSFIVALANKNDKVTNYDYSVREVSQISDTELYLWQKAVLEGTDTTVWYEKAVESGGTVGIGGKGYIVSYEAGDSASWTVTNHRGYELPDSGGMGTSHFTFGGLAMIAAALMYICITGHKRRKGGR